jgi:3-deoxy-D-manno-octulosonic-acid transferase
VFGVPPFRVFGKAASRRLYEFSGGAIKTRTAECRVQFTVRLLYNILFLCFFVLSSPYYFLRLKRRGNWQKNFAQRFGTYDSKLKQAITNRHTIWMHAVSVGEANICPQVISALETRLPNVKVVVSTTTTTGMGILQSKLPPHISKIYYPIDRRKWVARALYTIRPEAIVLLEAEIWPNFLWKAADLRIPVFLINARLSDRSYPRYKRFGILFRRLFASFAGIGVQSKADGARIQQLGPRPEAIHIVGNLKFDAAKVDPRRLLDVPGMLRQLGVPETAKLLVGGSTHAGEEAILVDQFLRLRKRFPDLFLVLVPRHFERTNKLLAELAPRKLKIICRTEIAERTQYGAGEVDCLLVNTTGELKYFYEQATMIFIGKSLTAEGGQNPIEPAALGKPAVFGPNMQNFADVARLLTARDAAVQVANAAELEQTLAELLANPQRCEQLGSNGLAVFHENLGAIDRTVEMIVQHLQQRELYIAPRS